MSNALSSHYHEHYPCIGCSEKHSATESSQNAAIYATHMSTSQIFLFWGNPNLSFLMTSCFRRWYVSSLDKAYSCGIENIIIIVFVTFTLYPAYSRVDRGKLVLRHSVPHLPPNSGSIACLVAELNVTL